MGTRSPVEGIAQRQLEREGWSTVRTDSGFPDFFCIRGCKIKLVEVKNVKKHNGLSARQNRAVRRLRRLGVTVEVRLVSSRLDGEPHLYVKSPLTRKHMSLAQRKRWGRN